MQIDPANRVPGVHRNMCMFVVWSTALLLAALLLTVFATIAGHHPARAQPTESVNLTQQIESIGGAASLIERLSNADTVEDQTLAAARVKLDGLSQDLQATKTAEVKDATNFKYGPYIKGSALPANPVDIGATPSDVVFNAGASLGNLTATGTNAGGWWFDRDSGKFIADVDNSGTGGIDYQLW